tara:strand:- start:1095 stop:1325 length:231 start_codon:yes stop_codon:yes gene_type:complete
MELIQIPSTIVFFLIFVVIGFIIYSIRLLSNKYLFHTPRDKSNKLLLKEILEDLGLEVPIELTESTQEVVKTIKGS